MRYSKTFNLDKNLGTSEKCCSIVIVEMISKLINKLIHIIFGSHSSDEGLKQF